MQTRENKKTNTKSNLKKDTMRYPSYVVAFSLKETYDDLATAQQMICKRSQHERIQQESDNNITPTNSFKIFENDTDKFDQIANNPENFENNVISPHSSINSVESITPTNSIKYYSSDEIGGFGGSVASVITMGAQETKIYIPDYTENQTSNKVEETTVIDIIKIKEESEEQEPTKEKDSFPEIRLDKSPEVQIVLTEHSKGDNKISLENNVLSNVLNGNQMLNEIVNSTAALTKTTANNHNTTKKRFPKCSSKKNINSKQQKFKHRSPKKSISTRLEKYCEKQTFVGAEKIQRDLYSSNVSTIVSRTQVLNQISLKENILDDKGIFSIITDDVSSNVYVSQCPMLTTAKTRLTDEPNQKTLKQKSSVSSYENDEIKLEVMNSVINLSSGGTTYITDSINAAVAVAYDRCKKNINNVSPKSFLSRENNLHLQKLTSSEMDSNFVSNLTSDVSRDLDDFTSVTIEISDKTLMNDQPSFDVSSDKFVIARTSSDFSRSIKDSTYTITNNSDTDTHIETSFDETPVKKYKPTKPLKTLLDIDMVHDMAPSSSSSPYNYKYNDVIITRNPNFNIPHANLNTVNNKVKNNKITNNILTKTMTPQKGKAMNKVINMPNQEKIQAMIIDNDIPQEKCAEEPQFPHMSETIWNRIVSMLDVAVKKIEENLVEKVVAELKKSLFTKTLLKDNSAAPIFANKIGSAVIVPNEQRPVDQNVQCDLVMNQIIDQMMQKFSSEGSKIADRDVTVRSLKSKIFEDIKVLKPPQVDMDKMDAATVSTLTFEVAKYPRLKTLLSAPATFIRENMMVITSVPAFMIALMCVYGVLILSMKPW